MKVLHIAHYDLNLASGQTFVQHVTNGVERFLTTLITHNFCEQYMLFFEFDLAAISIAEIRTDGELSFYTTYLDVDFSEQGLKEILKELIEQLALDVIHIHYQHEVVKQLPAIIKQLGIPAIATIHDESYLSEDFGSKQNYEYQQDVQDFFDPLDAVIFPHKIVEQRYCALYPIITKKSFVIANGVTIEKVAQVQQNEKLKVLFLGGFNTYKGAKIIKQLVELGDDNFEFHLLGKIEEDILFSSSETYTPNDLVEKMTKIAPDIVVLPSIVQETFSYTAAEATALGYPLLTFAVGALSEIENEGRGFVVKELTAQALLDKLLEIDTQKKNVETWWCDIYQRVERFSVTGEEEMILEYQKLYQQYVINISKKAANKVFFEQKNYQAIRQLLSEKRQSTVVYGVVDEQLKFHVDHSEKLMEYATYLEEHPIRNLYRSLLKKIGVKK